jgi:hypothetical protein
MSLTTDDKLAIQELSARYAIALDAGDSDAWLATWDDSGVWDGSIGRYEGRERLKQVLPDLAARTKNRRHIMANFVIDGDGQTAVQQSYLLIVDIAKQNLPGTAFYHDKLVKRNGKWLFSERRVAIDTPTA